MVINGISTINIECVCVCVCSQNEKENKKHGDFTHSKNSRAGLVAFVRLACCETGLHNGVFHSFEHDVHGNSSVNDANK